jgi:aminopeptidase
MSLEEFSDFFFAATIVDWAKVKVRQAKLARLMNRARKVRVTAPGTDLEFSIAGMKAINCCGERNIPDGEVFTAPVKDSVEGTITYNVPSIYQGKEFLGASLTFAAGKIVEAKCGDLTKALNEVFDTDPGARYVGEFSIGTNYAISQPMRNILFDEKIGGSMHFTPGQAYEEADNGNRSAVHWDLVLDLRPGGRIEFDGAPVLVDGRFVHKDLLDLNPKKVRRT